MKAEPDDSSLLIGEVRQFCDLWDLPNLSAKVSVDYSTRLRSSWGRTSVENRRIRLHLDLAVADEAFIAEVLCHELAHIAVFEKYGSGKRPHGCEWASFVRKAGFDPTLRLPARGSPQGDPTCRKQQFEHFCPVCQSVRYARKPMRQWRCSRCVEVGLQGELVVRELIDK